MNAGIYGNNFTKHTDQQRRGADKRTMRRKHIEIEKIDLKQILYMYTERFFEVC